MSEDGWNRFVDITGTIHGFRGTADLECVSCKTTNPKEFIIRNSYLFCARCDDK